MRKTLIATAALVLAAGNALAAIAPAAKHAAASSAPRATRGVQVVPEPGNSTAYERAITAYLDNVVNKARKKLPSAPASSPPQRGPAPGEPHYPNQATTLGGSHGASLPRVERITIGLKARAVLETPDGARLRVSPGAETPYGEVTAIRAAGVWFRMRGALPVVELPDISANSGGSGNAAHGSEPAQGPPMNVPPPPNFQPNSHP